MVASPTPKKPARQSPFPRKTTVEEDCDSRVLPSTPELDEIMRYQAALHRECVQLIHELEAFQAHRRGEPTHLARLSFGAPPMA